MLEKTMIKPKFIIKYIVIIIFSIIASIIFFSSKFIGTFPLPVIIPFLLVLIYNDVLSIIIIGAISLLVTNLFTPELGYEIILIPAALFWLILLSYAGKYTNEYIHEKDRVKRLSVIISVILFMTISFYFYNGLMGNPITYLKAKPMLQEYVNKYYKDKFTLEDFNYYGFKGPSYVYHIKDKKDGKVYYLSYIPYSKNIEDEYQIDSIDKINQNIGSKLINAILLKTNLKKENISIPSVNMGEEYDIDYNLVKNYSNKEIESLGLYLYKEASNVDSEEYLYSNSDEFSKGVYEIINALKETDYKYKEIYISSSASKGEYRIRIDNIGEVNSLEYIKNNVEIQKLYN
ncbi:YfjL-like protein [Faecalimicrobium dakarense]|uniref:YfjL-like protein n=1 Tax=Faecalimicrobium dakarense TaxID=1301100 RepID=UPI0004B43CDC|nr:hypothetical protein [[Clostridium] dakarense]